VLSLKLALDPGIDVTAATSMAKVAMTTRRFKDGDYFAAAGSDPRERAAGVDQSAEEFANTSCIHRPPAELA
jgi:transposase